MPLDRGEAGGLQHNVQHGSRLNMAGVKNVSPQTRERQGSWALKKVSLTEGCARSLIHSLFSEMA